MLREDADVEVVETESIDDLTEAIAARDGREIIVAGGDGSLNAFATARGRPGGRGSGDNDSESGACLGGRLSDGSGRGSRPVKTCP